MELTAEPLIPGAAACGPCLALSAPISFWGGVDPRTGIAVTGDYANWTTHPNNPMAKPAVVVEPAE